MTARFVLAPQAALDLFEIWVYVKDHTSVATADHVELAIRERITFLAGVPGSGHWRKDLTGENVKFFPVYSYLIVYRPDTKPLRIAAILDAGIWKKPLKAGYEAIGGGGAVSFGRPPTRRASARLPGAWLPSPAGRARPRRNPALTNTRILCRIVSAG
jgi:plasmid stabilization system protein ParE